jgi:RNA polymerase sigma-70 factor, ECF subfamily
MSEPTLDLEPHLSPLKLYARRLTHDRSRTDDLVQDTVIRALEKAHLFTHGTNLRGWLVTIMHNEFVNAARRHIRSPIMMPEKELDKIGRDETQTAPVELREVRRAVDGLPSLQRQVLLLHSVSGFKYEEIAAQLGVPLGTVRSRISRARERLHEIIDRPDSRLGLANGTPAQ